MEWWSIFFRIRKVIFGFIAIVSFLWAGALSVYIAREWPHFDVLQRILILSVIGINVFTSILLYLMIVVVFRLGLDLARMLFLLLLHAATAVMFTIYGHNFSCAIFNSKQLCQDVNLSFLIGSWSITGLHFVYIVYLLIMVPVPRPLPKVTPNPLLESFVGVSSRPSSMVSVDSATGLLRRDSEKSGFSSTGARRSDLGTIQARTYANNMPPTYGVRQGPPQSQRGRAYGAMGAPAGPPPFARTVARNPGYPTGLEARSNMVPPSLQSSFSRGVEQRGPQYLAPPKSLPLPNPFLDPISRQGTPNSVYSSISYDPNPMTTESREVGLERYQPLIPSPQNTEYSFANYAPAAPGIGPYQMPVRQDPYAMPGMQTAGAALRTHTATPHSIHSIAPSMHLTDATRTLPQPAHVRGPSDPIYRPYTASPTLHSRAPSDAAPLPNPFPPMVSRAEVRRFGSVSEDYHPAGHGGTYTRPQSDPRNAAHLAGALGRTPPRVEATVTSPSQWKQLVLSAATGRAL